ncbi:MAG: hypothetical protein KKD69_08225 [Euryarchaeota archaeon]|nr:hypothetical protein [Euryarchaeota archaeon]MBU4492432.1 hypothetical protein [Euryarchaeota archaeon]MCG2727537.1 hypothetical protein [Candidatus Methanoperedenaceae archaeon]
MKSWKESQEEVRKIKPDRQMASAILRMIEVRMKALEELKGRREFASLIVEDYYEIIKEALTALMAIGGYKTLSHEVLIAYLKEFYPQFSDAEIGLADQRRQTRNKIAYKGFFVAPEFVERNDAKMRELVIKITNLLREKLGK